MADKKRFLEIFSKVNKMSLNEDINYNTEEMDDFSDSVESNVKSGLGDGYDLFSKGVPDSIIVYTVDYGELEFKLGEDEGIELNYSQEGISYYIANYYTTIREIPFYLTAEFQVSVFHERVEKTTQFFTELEAKTMCFPIHLFQFFISFLRPLLQLHIPGWPLTNNLHFARQQQGRQIVQGLKVPHSPSFRLPPKQRDQPVSDAPRRD